MTHFHGFCSYPHGGWVLTGLICSCLAALASTMWGVSSCRFLYLDYTSDRGDFSDFYLDPTPDGAPVRYRTGAGMFTWLVPFENDWSDGSCQGYTQLQREAFGDHTFETARIFAVLSVLGGFGVTVWTWFLACISLGKFQIYMMSCILGLLAFFCGLTFLIFSSDLCNTLADEQGHDVDSDCTLDQGGLVTIAAVILWAVAALIAIIYIKPPGRELVVMNGQVTNAFDHRLEERRLRKEKDKQLANLLAEQKKSNNTLLERQRARLAALQESKSPKTPATTPSPPPPPRRHQPQSLENQDGTVELELGPSYSDAVESPQPPQQSRSSPKSRSFSDRGKSLYASLSSPSQPPPRQQSQSRSRSAQELDRQQELELDMLVASTQSNDPPGRFQRQRALKPEPIPMVHSPSAAEI